MQFKPAKSAAQPEVASQRSDVARIGPGSRREMPAVVSAGNATGDGHLVGTGSIVCHLFNLEGPDCKDVVNNVETIEAQQSVAKFPGQTPFVHHQRYNQ